MKSKHLIILIFIIFSISISRESNTIKLPDASYNTVKAAVARAFPGDIIIIQQSDDVIWDSSIVIDKPIIILGAGAGKTIIRSNISESNSGIFSYMPSEYNDSLFLRIAGFTLDGNEKSVCIYMKNSSIKNKCFIRIDNNHIRNAGGLGKNIRITGTIYGVIDNNIIEIGEKDVGISNYGISTGLEEWSTLKLQFGTGDAIYYEDNLLWGYNTFFDCGHGGRYITRYNTFNAQKALFPLFDFHGNLPELYGTMIGEVYGNLVNMNDYGAYFTGHRGGHLLSFYNKVNGSKVVRLYFSEEHHDSIHNSDFTMHITNSYYWNNRINGSLMPYYVIDSIYYGDTMDFIPKVNRDFYIHSEMFVGTEGCGCGKLEDRPDKCVNGVAYWVTDQDCSSDSLQYFGQKPKQPIKGILYKCNNNKWDSIYTPFVYPHPLRKLSLPVVTNFYRKY